MNAIKKLRIACLLLLFPFVLCACGKGAGASGRLGYVERDFAALLEWNRNGEGFACRVECHGGRVTDMEYLAPGSMQGLKIRLAEDGTAHVEKDGICAELPASLLFGWLLPAKMLLPQDIGILSVRDPGNGSLLRIRSGDLPDRELTVTLAPDGFPAAVTDGEITIGVRIQE